MSHPLPNFLIVGASRSGTTSLHAWLGTHPDVCLGEPKEVRFFDRDAEYERGLDHYRGAFAGWRGEEAVGEASPPYFLRGISFDRRGRYRFDPARDPAARVREALPEVRVVITLRDPVARAYSQFSKSRWQGRETLDDFRAVLEAELSGARPHREHANCWIYKNRYGIHVPHWIELFGRKRVHLMVFEEWTADPGAAYAALCRFLGVDDAHRPPVFEHRNAASSARSSLLARVGARLEGTSIGRFVRQRNRRDGRAPRLDAATRDWARTLFAEDVRAIEALLDRPLPAWRAAEAIRTGSR